MNILFMGTPDFAAASLEEIFRRFGSENKITVVTNPDKPQGRNYKMQMPAVKKKALELGLEVLQPENLRAENFDLASLDPQIIVVAAYGKILGEQILNYPKYGCINVHASLLPKYRGAAPINRVIMDGEKNTGVTIMKMAKGLDTGDMLSFESTPIGEEETAGELHDRLALIGARLVCDTMERIIKGEITPVPQDDSKSCYAAKIDSSVQKINWNGTADEVMHHINGLSPAPGALTLADGKVLKVYRASRGTGGIKDIPGKIITFKKKIEVACGEGSVLLCELQCEGSKRMSACDIINGRKLEDGMILGK